jgi:translation initiation factor 1A
MAKGKIGGKKGKMQKKKNDQVGELIYKEEMQEYAQTLRLLGDARIEVQCMDGEKRQGHIRGKMRKKQWIALGDIVLVALREYENDKCDIIHKYTEDHVRKLKTLGEIPESIKLPESENKEKDNDLGNVVFESGSEDEAENTNIKRKWNKKDLPSSDSDDASDSEEEKQIDIDAI